MLNPQTLWRISPEINVAPIDPPVRRINNQGIAILNTRRAGSRGKGKRLGATTRSDAASPSDDL
jgi:hypothetical protein